MHGTRIENGFKNWRKYVKSTHASENKAQNIQSDLTYEKLYVHLSDKIIW